jgi:hypothetical protein
VVLFTSTTGVATRTLSMCAPTSSVTCTVATNVPLSTMPVRVTDENPGSRKMRVNVPGGRPAMPYCPASSVTAVRTVPRSDGPVA